MLNCFACSPKAFENLVANAINPTNAAAAAANPNNIIPDLPNTDLAVCPTILSCSPKLIAPRSAAAKERFSDNCFPNLGKYLSPTSLNMSANLPPINGIFLRLPVNIPNAFSVSLFISFSTRTRFCSIINMS